MADNTPRLGLNTYGQGEDGWSHNDMAKALDELAIARGPIADRPASGDYDDELYHAIDQGITWRWDGTAAEWKYFTGTGSSSQPVPGTAHFDGLQAGNQLDIPVYSDDTNAPTGTHFHNDTDGRLKYKDSGGTIHEKSPPEAHGNSAHSTNYSPQGHNHSGESINPDEVSTAHHISGTRIDIRQFGADPTGTDPSDQAFQDAVAAANTGDTIVFRDGTFLMDSEHVVSKSLTLKGVNAEIVRTSEAGDGWLKFEGTGRTGTTSGLAAAASRGESTLTVSDASVFSVDDHVMVREGFDRLSDTEFDFAYIKAIDTTANTVTIDRALTFDYTTTNGVVEVVDMLESPKVVNLTSRHEGLGSHMLFEWCHRPVYEDVVIDGYQYRGAWAWFCQEPIYKDVTARRAHDKSSGNGEAIKLLASQDGVMYSPRSYDCRRGIDMTYGAHGTTIYNPIVRGYTVAGVSHHGQIGRDTTVVGGLIVEETGASASGAVRNNEPGQWMTVTGTSIRYDGHGMMFHSGVNVSGVTIEPLSSSAGEAFRVDTQGGVNGGDISTVRIDATINNPNDWTDSPRITVRDGHTMEDVHLNIRHEAASGRLIRVNVLGTLRKCTLAGHFESAATASYPAVRIDGDDTGIVEDMDVDLTVTGSAARGVAEMGVDTISGLRISGTYRLTDQVLRITSTPTTVEDIRVSGVTAPNASVYIGNANANYVWVTDCHASSVDIDSSATNVVTRDNQV